MSEEEFEERQLTKLISDLRDINSYTDFKNGAFIYDLGHYQGLLLVNEIERLNNIINELENYICEIEYDNRLDTIIWTTAVLIHNRLKELKGSDK